MKRNIVGIVPSKNEEKIIEGIKLNRNIVPNCDFCLIDYHNLLIKIEQGDELYDILLAYKPAHNTHENICVAALEMKVKNYDTLFLLSFNPINEKFNYRDVGIQEVYINKLMESNMNGIVITDSIDESFLMTIIRDMLDGKEEYSKIKKRINDQRDLIIHGPGYTEIGHKPQT